MRQAKGRVAQWIFDGPALKVERAYSHVKSLVERLLAYRRSDFCFPFVDQEIKEGRSGLSVQLKPLPPATPLIIGDAVHNLRSALDHLIVNIVMSAGNKPSNYLVFPFAQPREELVRSGRMKEIHETVPDVYDIILKI